MLGHRKSYGSKPDLSATDRRRRRGGGRRQFVQLGAAVRVGLDGSRRRRAARRGPVGHAGVPVDRAAPRGCRAVVAPADGRRDGWLERGAGDLVVAPDLHRHPDARPVTGRRRLLHAAGVRVRGAAGPGHGRQPEPTRRRRGATARPLAVGTRAGRADRGRRAVQHHLVDRARPGGTRRCADPAGLRGHDRISGHRPDPGRDGDPAAGYVPGEPAATTAARPDRPGPDRDIHVRQHFRVPGQQRRPGHAADPRHRLDGRTGADRARRPGPGTRTGPGDPPVRVGHRVAVPVGPVPDGARRRADRARRDDRGQPAGADRRLRRHARRRARGDPAGARPARQRRTPAAGGRRPGTADPPRVPRSAHRPGQPDPVPRPAGQRGGREPPLRPGRDSHHRRSRRFQDGQ